MLLVQETKIVSGGGPVLLDTAGITGDYVSMKNYHHLTVVVGLTPASGTDTAAITLKQASDVAGTGEKALDFTRAWRNPTSTSNDTLTETVYASSITTSAVAAKELFVLEIDAADLDTLNGFDCVRANVTDPGVVSTPAFVLYILSGSRFAQEIPPSAIVG